ncbi:MAG: hypothetical protein KGL91_03205 [Xanthomonadaceae bacterium]|nr:hypothetical protein [Xanthomonadaceae bacterium]
MGRLLDALRAKSECGARANPANPLISLTIPAPISGISGISSGGESENATPRVAESQESQGVPARRARLLALAIDEGLDADLIHALADADLLAIPADYTNRNLRAYLRALDADRRMDAGMIPLDWGEPHARTCEACGPVLLWETCPDVVKACPWCFRRKAGKRIPRPRVQVANGVLNGFTDKGVTPAMREVLLAMRGQS